MPELLNTFSTVFFVFGLGFAVQRIQPLGEQTLTQLSALLVKVLVPSYLFFTMATGTTLDVLSASPVLVGMGVGISLLNYFLATIALKPCRVAEVQRSAFRFSAMLANTGFLGLTVCGTLFGPLGLVYAVLYDFGSTLVALTLGVWELNGGRLDDWHPLFANPLIWGVVAGLLWVVVGWPFPGWLAAPFEKLGSTTLPLALLVCGAQVGNIRSQASTGLRQITGLTATRLVVVPLIVGLALMAIGWRDTAAKVTTIQAAMPTGIVTSIMAKTHGADAEFAASATLWSTLASMVTLPLVVFLLVYQFPP
jgi:predicted permease